MSKAIQTLKKLYKETQEKTLEDFFTFLKFESVSSEMEHQSDIVECVEWLKVYIEKMGFKTELWKTPGHPTLFASCLEAGPKKPTLLIYNHYDVQPVDPLDLWKSPPFDPTLRGKEIYARGAQDNKGQCFYVLQALKILKKKEGRLPLNIKLCIEGEEETGSQGLSKILKAKKKDLSADYLAIVDLGIPEKNRPAITLGVRGIVTMDLKLQGSNTDLHSGSHGGIVFNPIHALIEMLSKLRTPSGQVAVPGFYEDVAAFSKKERTELSLDFDPKRYKKTFGAVPSGGERKYEPQERAWTRPTLEVNGISGGYAGSGFKTVIPAKAMAKISCRLVPNQEPYKIGKLVAEHIKALAPDGIQVEVSIRPGVGGAVRSPISSKVVQAFSIAYEEVFRKKTEYTFTGGSIPIVNELSEVSGAQVVLVGLGLPDDLIHAPNEHFGVDRLEKGALIISRAVEILSKMS